MPITTQTSAEAALHLQDVATFDVIRRWQTLAGTATSPWLLLKTLPGLGPRIRLSGHPRWASWSACCAKGMDVMHGRVVPSHSAWGHASGSLATPNESSKAYECCRANVSICCCCGPCPALWCSSPADVWQGLWQQQRSTHNHLLVLKTI